MWLWFVVFWWSRMLLLHAYCFACMVQSVGITIHRINSIIAAQMKYPPLCKSASGANSIPCFLPYGDQSASMKPIVNTSSDPSAFFKITISTVPNNTGNSFISTYKLRQPSSCIVASILVMASLSQQYMSDLVTMIHRNSPFSKHSYPVLHRCLWHTFATIHCLHAVMNINGLISFAWKGLNQCLLIHLDEFCATPAILSTIGIRIYAYINMHINIHLLVPWSVLNTLAMMFSCFLHTGICKAMLEGISFDNASYVMNELISLKC